MINWKDSDFEPTATFEEVTDVDQLFSDLLYAPPRAVRTPDGKTWAVFVYTRDESLQLRCLDDGRQIEPDSGESALAILRGGRLNVAPFEGQL